MNEEDIRTIESWTGAYAEVDPRTFEPVANRANDYLLDREKQERRRGHRVAPAIAEGGARSGGGTGAARAPPRLRLSRAPNGDSRTSRSFVRKTGLLCYVDRCRRIKLTTSDPMEAVTLKGTPPVTRECAVLDRFQWKRVLQALR
jgi:hypothetical protein